MSTLRLREHRQARALHRYVGTLRFFARHRRQARTAIGRREVRRARVWVAIIRRELGETRGQMRPRYSVPVSFVLGALCVHSGWHYRLDAHGDYSLFGRGYIRTSDVPDSIAGGSGEGGWDAANGSYGGGLQMDGAFQARYGREFLARLGAAGKWPVSVQILVAYRGWLVQGWGAWPNTSRACGLR
jgi:hypothetical protein